MMPETHPTPALLFALARVLADRGQGEDVIADLIATADTEAADTLRHPRTLFVEGAPLSAIARTIRAFVKGQDDAARALAAHDDVPDDDATVTVHRDDLAALLLTVQDASALFGFCLAYRMLAASGRDGA